MTGVCRACGSPTTQVLDLGAQPAADLFPDRCVDVETDPVHCLTMSMCAVCALAQLSDDDTSADEPRGVEPQALIDQAADAVDTVAAAGWLRGHSVREFASPHGGSWLPLLRRRGFQETTGPADVVLDSFGIMHDADQSAAFSRRASALSESGVLLLQFHTLGAIVAGGQWNALRHGHFAYYSMTSLVRLLSAAGLVARSAWNFELYGGTVLVAATLGGGQDDSVRRILDEERTAGVADPSVVKTLQSAADSDVYGVRSTLIALRENGRSVYAYGAASRAVALFASAGITTSVVTAVADASPAKQGRRMPGTDIPIISPVDLVAARPDVIFLTLPDLHNELVSAFPSLQGRWWLHGTDIQEGLR